LSNCLTSQDIPLLLGVGFRYGVFGGSLWKRGSDGMDYACVDDDNKFGHLVWYKTGTLLPLGERLSMDRNKFVQLFG